MSAIGPPMDMEPALRVEGSSASNGAIGGDEADGGGKLVEDEEGGGERGGEGDDMGGEMVMVEEGGGEGGDVGGRQSGSPSAHESGHECKSNAMRSGVSTGAAPSLQV